MSGPERQAFAPPAHRLTHPPAPLGLEIRPLRPAVSPRTPIWPFPPALRASHSPPTRPVPHICWSPNSTPGDCTTLQRRLLAGIGPHPLQPRPLPLHLGQHQLGAITVLQVCRMDHHGQPQPHGIHYEVALATLDFLAGVIASGPPFSVVFTVWLSIMAALGVGWRPSAARTTGRREACTRSQVPSRVQRRKYLYRVCPGGRSCGTRRQAQPLRSTYRMPCTTSRRSTVRGRPPGLAAGSRGAHRAHWASLRSLEYRSRVMSMQVYGVGVLPIQ